ncbi:MAG: hypothetical protein JXC85_06545 [Candidatus Aenigmarchaeota archaeon]|nr:hypothetical protein [Candidatus Aenigmarchaeota archaeon]
MKIEIEDRYLWLFLAVLIFLIGASYVMAIGENYLVHGHDQDEINLPACSSGQVLKRVGSVWSCQNDNKGTLDCVVSTSTSSGSTASVSCASSRVVTGGGCDCNTLVHITRRSGNGWYCACSTGAGGVTAYAVCCMNS